MSYSILKWKFLHLNYLLLSKFASLIKDPRPIDFWYFKFQDGGRPVCNVFFLHFFFWPQQFLLNELCFCTFSIYLNINKYRSLEQGMVLCHFTNKESDIDIEKQNILFIILMSSDFVLVVLKFLCRLKTIFILFVCVVFL